MMRKLIASVAILFALATASVFASPKTNVNLSSGINAATGTTTAGLVRHHRRRRRHHH
ncbi:MAG TPA: hypothetical protein VI756_30500 [Blastocatellia bacterium]